MNTKIHRIIPRSALVAGLILGVSALAPLGAIAQEDPGIAAFASEEAAPSFDNVNAGVEALKAALAAGEVDALAEVLGLDAAALRADEATMENFEKIREGAARLLVVEELDDRALIDVGAQLWPLPFPLVRGEDGKWSFDTFAGLEEIVNRRVGRNELEAIATMRAYVDAQHDYAAEDRDGDGVLEFAQQLVSSEGATDGLYWPADLGMETSPAGAFVDEAALGGDGYFGYRFRILKGQGDNIAGGAYDYLINGNMIAGFALLAWPVSYAETGVNSFMVSHHGIVYEADLGPATEAIAKYIDRFNPGEDWNVSED